MSSTIEPYHLDVDPEDTDFHDATITNVDAADDKGFYITDSDGWSFNLPHTEANITPKEGDDVRFYGHIGYPVRGVQVNGATVFYRTPYMQEITDKYNGAVSKAKHHREQTKNIPKLEAQYAALYPRLQREVDAARRKFATFSHEYMGEGYEYMGEDYYLFILTEAQKIYEATKDKVTVTLETYPEYRNYIENTKAVQDVISKDHSGMTYGAAVATSAHLHIYGTD